MLPRNRRKRAILRDRRRGWTGITPLIGPLSGFDLYLLHRYPPALTQPIRPYFPEEPQGPFRLMTGYDVALLNKWGIRS